MRQVDQLELTYALFAATRGWSVNTRRDIFARNNGARLEITAQQISDRLRVYVVIDDRGVPLDRDARVRLFCDAVATFPGAVGKLWLSPEPKRQDDARRAAAVLLFQALQPYEVLADSPFGETLFFRDIVAPAYAFAPNWP
ncbi:hypothetical protein [Sphingomonas koreensis]